MNNEERDNVSVDENLQNDVVTEETVQSEQPVQNAKTSSPEKSFRELREKAERIERERDEAIKYAKEVEARLTKTQTEEPDSIDIGEDDLAEGKHIKAISKELRRVSREFDEYKKSNTSMTEETRLRLEHPDLDKVISRENLEILRNEYPEFANLIETSNTGIYNKGKAAANLIKKLGIYKEDTFAQEKAMVAQNSLKPKPSLAISSSDSPLSTVNAFAMSLTPDMKKKLQKDLRDAVKKRSF
jgi:hypothetical protein